MHVVRWNPFREIDEIFGRYGQTRYLNEPAHDWRPLVDIRETDDAYAVDVELPTVDPKEVTVSLNDGVLHISGERKLEESDTFGQLHRSERRYGNFTRSFRLPRDADADSIKASAKDGVITVRVAKSDGNGGRTISIDVE